jgi:hypothetical protein
VFNGLEPACKFGAKGIGRPHSFLRDLPRAPLAVKGSLRRKVSALDRSEAALKTFSAIEGMGKFWNGSGQMRCSG